MARLARAMPADAPQQLQPLRNWLERHLHLSAWENHLRDQALRRRREIYRTYSRNLANTHGTVVLEKFDLRRVTRHGDTSADRTKPQAGDQRTIAAPSILRTTLKALTQWQEVEAAYTTQHCSWCGFDAKWDAAESIMHRCDGCGQLFDQDHNAARNLLIRSSQIEQPAEQKADLPNPALDNERKVIHSIGGS
jgi:transposase